eukprot:gnl/MRDRNA2_/MRDRNA2_132418_c0_seq1.p1 gnl/MRDRNA2_/MRDRNA2_132418_c0~~gnl/MRDRNA2_/MRDRNA2_132418_c0_seq1.p1  ORF type:complete len:325 (-),score=95.98 gnl/MRDRNA2_/MRDRNA2_132418_c0_seq1:11-895(-)
MPFTDQANLAAGFANAIPPLPPASGMAAGSMAPPPGGPQNWLPNQPPPVPAGGVAAPGGQAYFPSLFGGSEMSLQEISAKAHQLQQKIDENAEQEKATLRGATENRHREIESQASELSRHAASSIEAYKTQQMQNCERQKDYQQAVLRQQAEQAKRLVDQQAAQAIAAVEMRERQLKLQKQQQELLEKNSPQPFGAFGRPMGGPGSMPPTAGPPGAPPTPGGPGPPGYGGYGAGFGSMQGAGMGGATAYPGASYPGGGSMPYGGPSSPTPSAGRPGMAAGLAGMAAGMAGAPRA